VEAEFTGAPKWFPSETAGISYGDNQKTGKARITLDFNLKDFQTLAGIPRMTTTNSMEVYKGLREEELGVTLFGPTFGMKGTIKKVQGRHEAVRLLVQASMIQMIGKYLALPYWRLLGDDVNPDKVVLDSISATYYRMGRADRVGAAQQWLILHGYEVAINNRLDSATQEALRKFDPSFAGDENGISEALFTKLYLTIPVNRQALARRSQINDYFAKQMQQTQEAEQPVTAVKAKKQKEQKAAPVEATPVAQQVADVPAEPVQEVAQAPRQEVQAAPAPVVQRKAAPVEKAATAAPAEKPRKFGRQLSPDEW
jgi:hypothetical protein